MRALVQRVRSGKVSVDDQPVAQIGQGLIILLGVGIRDTADQVHFLTDKIAHLRIFEDPRGKLNLSLLDIGGEAIVVSQFTLYGDLRKGRRPSFIEAARPEIAAPLVEEFSRSLQVLGIPVQCGIFGAHMLVEIQNDGPVTIWIENDP